MDKSRIEKIEELTRRYEGINEDIDVRDLIAEGLRSDPWQTDDVLAQQVAMLINQM